MGEGTQGSTPEKEPGYLLSYNRIYREDEALFQGVVTALQESGTGITAQLLPDDEAGWARAADVIAATRLRELQAAEEARTRHAKESGAISWSGGSIQVPMDEQANNEGRGMAARSRGDWLVVEIHLPPGTTRDDYFKYEHLAMKEARGTGSGQG